MAQSVLDTDGDGLSDTDEINIYHTDPAKADTDGDGQPDGHEVRAGTDPRSKASLLRILGSPVALAGGGWRIQWSSVPGKSYQLMRWSGDDLAAPGNPRWLEVAKVSATGTTTQADDLTAQASRRRYYRVVLVEAAAGDDRTPPVISPVRATPGLAQVEGLVTLAVTAQDTNKIAGVTFYDGASLLGPGIQVDAEEWRFNWPVTFDLNGARSLTAQATDAAGNRATSVPVIFSVNIAAAQTARTIGQLPIHADRLQTNGAVVVPSGNVRLGIATLGGNGTVNLNPAQGLISGSGKVSLPGIGQVFDGAFVVDPATGILSPAPGTTPSPGSITINPKTLLSPETIKINLLTAALEGKGVFTVQTGAPAQPQSLGRSAVITLGPARIEGDFKIDLAAQSGTVTGKAAYAGVEGVGAILLSLAESTFQLTGEVNIQNAANAEIFSLREASFKMKWNADRRAEFSISGKPSTPKLAQLNLTLSGSLAATGNLRLTGQAEATLEGFQFAPLTLTLDRPASAGQNLDLRAGGTVRIQDVASLGLSGRVQTDGSLVELVSTAEVNFGNGIRLSPRKDAQGNPLPVLRLNGGVNGSGTFEVSGDFQAPAETGVQTMAVSGQLQLEPVANALRVRSFIATNQTALARLTLPGGIELRSASVTLSYAGGSYAARVRGELTLGKAGLVVASSVAADLLLRIDENDPKVIMIDSDVNFAGVNLREVAWFGQGQLRVTAQTVPPGGSAALRNGSAGFFPQPSALANGRLVTSRPLGAVDFHLFASDVFANVVFSANGLDLVLTNGVLRLPDRFTTLAAGECAQNRDLPNGGVAPGVALTPGSALTLHYLFGQSADTATLRFEGGLDFANFGLAVPSSPGQPSPAALKLCSGRLVFRGSELPALENLNGKIRVRDLGAFNLLAGTLDPRGVFSVRANGQATLNGATFDLTNFEASYATNQFKLAAASTLDLGDGIKLEPDDITDPSRPAPPVISASYNGATQVYELALAGKLKLPDAQYVAMRGRVANGSLSLTSQGIVQLGADVTFRPVSVSGNLTPVLQLESITEGGVSRLQLALAGELLVPGADGLPHPMAMAGKLRLRVATGGQTEVSSLSAIAALPNFDFGGGVRLGALVDPADATKKLPLASLAYASQSGYRITFAGELLAPGIIQKVQLAGAIQNNQLLLASVGQADFGNNFKMGPLLDPANGELPVLKLEAVTTGSTAKARFNIAGNLQVPDANGTPRAIQVTGTLVLAVGGNGAVKIESFATQAGATSFELGSGLKLEALPDPNNAAQRLPVISAVYGEQAGYEVRLAGKMILAGAGTPQAQFVTLQGRINNNLLELNSFAAVHLGNGVWLQPLGGNQAVLQLLANQGQQTEASFAVNGAFLIPADSGATRTVAVGGSLRVGLVNGAAQIKSFTASSATTNDWTLPGTVRLQRAGVALAYATGRFTAELNGQLQVGPTTATLDHGILVFEDETDAANIRLDAQVTLRSVPLGDLAYLQVGSARLELATTLTGARPRNAFGRLSLGGSAGLFPVGALPAAPVRANFNLFVENMGVSARFSSSNLVFSLTNGTLRLPEVFTSGASDLCAEAGTGPSVALGPNTAIELTYTGGTSPSGPGDVALSARGTLKFGNLGFDVPGMPGLAAQLCSATLVFQGNQLPALAGVSGSLRIPVSEQNLQLTIVNGAWKLNGYPSGTILLAQDFKILDREGFTLTLLGGQSCGANNVATGISIEEGQALSNPPRPPKFTLHGGLRFAVPESVLRRAVSAVTPNAGTPPVTQVSVEGCGSVTFFPDRLPDVALDRVSTSGDFILGNGGGAQAARAALDQAAGQSQGITIKGATITLENIGNMFNFSRSPANPFTITLSGLIAIPSGPAFGLQNTRFVFDNANPRVPLLPRFEPGTLEYQKNEWALVDVLPIQVRLARLTFKDGAKELPDILKPDNVKVTFSGGISIPPNDPYVQGDINDLEVTFRSDGTPVFSIDGFAVTLKPGMDIPPIEEISGSVFVGGLSEPVNPFFTGRVAGSYQGYKLKFLMAFNLAGFVGMCVDVNAGAVGIPLAQTGFLITGASGGVSAANSNGDPCSFQTYMDPVTGRPISSANSLPPGVPPFPVQAMTWTQLRDYAKRFDRAAQAYGQAVAADAATVVLPSGGSPMARAAVRPQATTSPDPLAIPCPGDCPPPTVNIFCQPHPDQAKFPGRIITKFTSIDEVTLNRVFGITEDHIRQLQSSGVALARTVAHQLRVTLDATIPAPDPAQLGAQRAAQIRQLQVEAFDTMESAYFDAITLTIGNQNAPGILYGLIRDLVYAGLPCADATFRVSGTMSHLAVSSFLSVTGEGTLSTAGTAGIGGTVNLYGLPIGQGKMFVAATDSQGQPNPSICGEINVAFGPLELGWLKAAMQCDECVTGVLNVFAQLVGSLALDTLNNLTAKVAPRFVGSSPQQLAAQLTAVEKTAFIAEILQLPAASLPPDLPQRMINALGASFNALDPRILLCGEVRPRLFGLPLSPELVGASMQVSKTGRDVNMKFSPSFLLALILDPRVMPPIDTAVIGYSEVWPDPAKALLAGLSGSLTPANASKYVEDNIQNILQNSTYTINYELCPLGLKISRAAARVVNPNLLNHPVIRVPAWKRPEDRGLPSRADLLLAAVRANLLGNALWKGTTNDLANVYADDATKNQVRGLSLAEDYFPHGGFIGAGYIQLPRFLYDAPVSLYQTMLDPNGDPNTRLRSTATFVLDYLLKNVEAGQLGFYVPAPNPPAFVDAGGRPLKPSQLLQGLMKFDTRDIHTPSLYSFDQSFLAGQITGKLLDIPIAQARVVGVPADAGVGRSESILQITANGPMSGWLQQLVPQANLIFEMRQAPPQPIEQWASNSWRHLNNVLASNPSTATALTTVQTFLSELATNVPKTKLEAAVTLQIPPSLTNLVQIDGNSNARLVAYSPQYEPGAVGSGPLIEARRQGGIAMQANLKFGPYFSIPNAELSVLPRENGLPVLAGRFGPTSASLPGGVSMRNVMVDFNSAAPSLTASGSISAIQLGQAFQIVPLAGNEIPAQLQLSNGQSGTFKVGPARLTFNSVFDGATAIRVHGATANDPFTFSTSGPWNANLTFEGGDPVQLVVGGQTVLQINRASLLGAGVSRDEQGVTRLKLTLAGRTTYTFAPNLPLRQSFTLSSDTELVIGSDGKFSLDAAIGNQQVGTVGIGGRVTLNNDPDLTFTLGGTLVLPPSSGFVILPRVDGSPLAGSVQVRRNGAGQLESVLRLKPARFALTSLMDGASAFFIDGGTATGDFTFSPDGPWSARLTKAGESPNVVRVGGLAVLQYSESSVQSAGVTRDAAGVARVTVNLRGQSELVAFPGSPVALTFKHSADTVLALGSDGKFLLDTAMVDQPFGPITLQGRARLANDPVVTFTLGGRVILPPLPGLAILPRVAGSPLEGALEIKANPGGEPSRALRLKPARLNWSTALGAPQNFLLDGGTDTQDFTFSSSDPWSARVTKDGSTPLSLMAGSETVLQLDQSQIQSGTVARDATGVMRLTLVIAGGSTLTAFPGKSFAQSFTLSSATELKIASDGTFSFSGAINDQAAGQITLRGLVSLSNTPALRFSLGGTLTVPALGGVSILPRVDGGTLEGALLVEAGKDGSLAAAVRVKPARLAWSTGLGATKNFLIDGGADGVDFTFSTSGPWSARVRLDSASPLELRAGNDTVLQLSQAQIQSGTVARDVAGVMRLSLVVAGGSTLTAFPGKSFAQSFTLSSATELQVASDGTFVFSGAINDQAAGQITLRGAVSFGNTPAFHFSLGGTLTVPTLGGVSILPRVDGGVLEGALLVGAGKDGSLAAAVRVKPARLAWSTGLGATKNFLIDGGADGVDFTFSTSGPWSARVRLDSASPLELRAGNDTVLQLSQAQIQSGTVARDVTGVMRLSLMVAGGSTLTAFPGKSFAQSFTLSSATELQVASDGTFAFNGAINDQAAGQVTLRGAISLTNSPILRFGLGGTLTVPPLGGISILPRLDGGALEGGLVIERGGDGNLAANLRLKPARLRYVAVLGATQTFQIDGGDSNTDFTYSTSGPWNARLSQQGTGVFDLNAGPVRLASITRNSSLAGTVSRDAAGIGHINFSLDAGTTVTAFPDLVFKQTYHTQGAASLLINGDGTFQLATTTSEGLPFTNLPIGALASGATATLTQNGLALAGSVTGGVLDKVTVAAGVSVTAAINITSAGGPVLNGSASVKVNTLTFGPFSLAPLSGATFNATLGAGGLSIPAGAQLSFNGRSLGSFSLPSFTIPPTGNFSIKLGPVNCALGPQGQGTFAIENALFEFSVANGLGSAKFTAGNLVVPAPGGAVAARAGISGNLNSNGTFTLAGLTEGEFSPAGLPFARLGAKANAVLSQDGLTVEGTASGGVLSVVPITGGAAVTARIGLTANGIATLSANVSLTLNQLVYGPFAIAPLNGPTFSASLGSAGVIVPGGAKLLFSGQTVAADGLPSFTIPSSGAVDFTARPASVSLKGFTITSPALRFLYLKGEASLAFSGGALQVPVPSSAKPTGFGVSGTLNSNGDFNLTGSTSGTLALGGLPIPSMSLAGGSTVTLNPGGLTLAGNLSGGLLGFVTPAGNVTATVSVATGGGLSLQGAIAVNVQPFHAAPFHVEPVTGNYLSASLSNSGLSFTGARLRVDGIFETTVNLPDFSVQNNGEISRTVTVPSMKLGGISCSGLSFTFKRAGGIMSLSPFEANLAISNFSQKLTGSINSQGTMELVFNGSLTLGGFTAGNGKLTLGNAGLAVQGSFNVTVLKHTFNGSLFVSGTVDNSGRYVMTGNGAFDFGGFKTDTFTIQFNKNVFFRDSGKAPALDYGGLKVPLPDIFITSNGGVSGFNGSQTVDSGWKGFAGVNARLVGTVSLSAASNGDVSGNLGATFYWWIGPTPNDDFKPSGQSRSVSGGIGSDGKFFVDDNRGKQNGFNFDLW